MERGADTIDYFKRREGTHDSPLRPMRGDTARALGEEAPASEAALEAALREHLEDKMRLRRAEE